MKYDQFSLPTFTVFAAFVGVVLGLSFFLGRRAKGLGIRRAPGSGSTRLIEVVLSAHFVST